MGNNQSACPVDFEKGDFSCRMKCPDGFKYAQTFSSTGGIDEKCVYMTNNEISFPITKLHIVQPGQPEPAEFQEERTKVEALLKTAEAKVQAWKSIENPVGAARDVRASQVSKFNSIQNEFATYKSAKDVSLVLKDVQQSLKPMRPPTAPASDIEIEKKAVIKSTQHDFLFIQIALFIVFLCLLNYLFVPLAYSHYIAFLLLCVAVALGIFLRK